MILSLIRKRTDATTDERFAVNETYPIDSVRQPEDLLSLEKLIEILKNSPPKESIRKVLNPLLRKENHNSSVFFLVKKKRFFFFLAFGSAVLDECLLKAGLTTDNCTLNIEQGIEIYKE